MENMKSVTLKVQRQSLTDCGVSKEVIIVV
jgi:hypothetical protein